MVFPDGRIRPDPAARAQVADVHGPSALFDPGEFRWTDGGWSGVPLEALVFYEMHVGTFTEEGTLDAAAVRLPELVDLGITCVELMPLQPFAGARNWGYDGVLLHAVHGGLRRAARRCSVSWTARTRSGWACVSTWSTTTSVPRETTWESSAPTPPRGTTRPGATE